MRALSLLSVGCGLLAMSLMGSYTPDVVAQGPQHPKAPHNLNPKGGRYVGVKVCKNCHVGEKKGDAYTIWKASPHAKAWETLGTDKAKEVAKKVGLEGNPQEAAECLKCHATGYGLDKKAVRRSLKIKDGVQCESCHGPGEAHKKKRMKEKSKKLDPTPIDPGEMTKSRSLKTCEQCHNENSPTFKPFCLKERMKEIEHYDPRKGRSKEQLEALRNSDAPNCAVHGKKKDGGGK